MINYKFYNLLLVKNIIQQKDLTMIQNKNDNHAFRVLLALVKIGIADKHLLGRIWGDSIDVAYVNLEKYLVDKDIARKIPQEFAKEHKVVALYKFGEAITVAVQNPKNFYLQDRLEDIFGVKVSMVFAFPDDIDKALRSVYSVNAKKQQITEELEDSNIADKDISVNVKQADPEIHPKTKEVLVDNTKSLFRAAFEGKVPKKEEASKVSDEIVENITYKIDVSQCINNLRINDEYTYSHSINVAILASIMGKVMNLSSTQIKQLTLSALLHDIGNMRIPKNILYKKGELLPEESALVKNHTKMGAQIITKMELPYAIAEVALNHHEFIDGSGYPRQLHGDQISFITQLVSMVNIYDNLIATRPNRNSLSVHEAINVMLLETAGLFNPTILFKFVNLVYKKDAASLKAIFKSIIR